MHLLVPPHRNGYLQCSFCIFVLLDTGIVCGTQLSVLWSQAMGTTYYCMCMFKCHKLNVGLVTKLTVDTYNI